MQALAELEAQAAAQWSNGLIPQIIFNPTNKDEKYYPGPTEWKTTKINGFQTSGIIQPPIQGMAVLAIYNSMASKGMLAGENLERLRNVAESFYRFIEYLDKYRNDDSGILSIVHPWESGLDNSPLWETPHKLIDVDAINDDFKYDIWHRRRGAGDLTGALKFVDHRMYNGSGCSTRLDEFLKENDIKVQYYKSTASIDITPNHPKYREFLTLFNQSYYGALSIMHEATEMRPEDSFYYRNMELVKQFAELNWDYDQIMEKSPFNVKDILLTSITVRAADSLAEVFNKLGDIEKVNKLSDIVCRINAGIEALGFDAETGIFPTSYIKEGKVYTQYIDTVSSFGPLLTGKLSLDKLGILIDKLEDPYTYGTLNPVPSTPAHIKCGNKYKSNPDFDLRRYWKGPSWPIINLLIIEGLKQYPGHERAQALAWQLGLKTTNMIKEAGLYENFNPDILKTEAAGLGKKDFTWSSVIYLYLLEQQGVNVS